MNEKRWEEKYTIKTVEDIPEPAKFLQHNAAALTGGRALDIAMGAGQNSVFLAQCGYDVTGVDRSATAVGLARDLAHKRGVSLTAVEADVLSYEIRQEAYDAIINFYFLERSLIPKIKAGLKKNGLVFFETYTLEQERFGGPHTRDFLLKPNELLAAFLDLFIIFYHERVEETPRGSKALASLIGQKV
ncbi:MAG: methyltransferase domain-containing protein [Pseudomonadota bacterium]